MIYLDKLVTFWGHYSIFEAAGNKVPLKKFLKTIYIYIFRKWLEPTSDILYECIFPRYLVIGILSLILI